MQKSVFFIQENATFIQVLIYQPHNQLLQAIKQLHTFARKQLILCKPTMKLVKN